MQNTTNFQKRMYL